MLTQHPITEVKADLYPHYFFPGRLGSLLKLWHPKWMFKAIVSTALLIIAIQSVTAATIAVPSGGDVQAAINVAQLGDTIILQAGGVFETSDSFVLPDKGPGTAFITITTSDPSTIPDGLNNYPNSYTRITTSMAANMPKLVAASPLGMPAIYLRFKAHHFRFVGVEITNKDVGAVFVRLVGSGFDGYEAGISDYAHDITFDQCFIHPFEETGDVSTNYHLRSVEKGIMFNGNALTVTHSAIQGFTGWNRYAYSGGSSGTIRLDTNAILIGNGLGPMNIENNLLEGEANNLFIGGSGAFSPNKATATNITMTSCTLSQVANLNVGDLIAIHDNNLMDSIAPSHWVNGQILSITGNNVTYTHLTTKYKADNDNTYLPAKDGQLPSEGETVQWNGYTLENVTIRRNIIPKQHLWYADLGGQKGLFEFKFIRHVTVDGNLFPGAANGFVLTPRNQGGDTPWAEVSYVTISNNWWYETGNQQVALSLSDNEYQNVQSHDITISNNLATYPGGQERFAGYAFSQISSGSNLSYIHNTILIPSHFLFGGGYTQGLTVRDNIIRSAYYLVPCSMGNNVTSCWPNANVHHNVLLNDLGIDVTGWTSYWTDHTWVQNTVAGMGFSSPSANLDQTGNYRLLSTSPYHNAASDGKDLGVDYDQLYAAIFGTGSIATPTPPPSPTATPTPTPLPVFPSPTPTPSSNHTLSGSTFYSGGGPFSYLYVELMTLDRVRITHLQEQDSTFAFSVPDGIYIVRVETEQWNGGYNNQPSEYQVTVCGQDVTGLNFTVGNSQYYPQGGQLVTPCAGPVPTPTPTPTPKRTPLTASITSPTTNATYSLGSSVTIQANASDTAGNVTNMSFTANSQTIGSASAAPYEVAWSNMSAGTYTVTATAQDDQGVTVTSLPITVKISKAVKSVRGVKTKTNTISNSVSVTQQSLAQDSGQTSALTTLVADLDQTYSDFLDEKAMFPAAAVIEKYLFAASYLARASAALSAQQTPSSAVSDRLKKIDSYLSFCEDLMVDGVISSSTVSTANQVNALVNLSLYQPEISPVGSLGVIVTPNGTARLASVASNPFSTQTATASGGGSFELADVSVTFGGEATKVLSVSPTELTVVVPADLNGGIAEIIVSSREGFTLHGAANVAGLNPRLFGPIGDSSGGGVVLDTFSQRSGPFSATPAIWIGLDARTRLSIIATGLSSGLSNWDVSNDLWLSNGKLLENLAENVSVLATAADGRAFWLTVEYAGAQGQLPGIDQVDVVLPSELAGAGTIQLTVVAGGHVSNTMTFSMN